MHEDEKLLSEVVRIKRKRYLQENFLKGSYKFGDSDCKNEGSSLVPLESRQDK